MLRHALFGILLASPVALVACLDFTPHSAAPVDITGDGGGAVGSADGGGAACLACVAGADGGGAPCAAEYAACTAMAKCAPMFLCGLELHCYAPGANLVSCLTTCGGREGLVSQSDPAVTPFIALYGCATAKCAETCALP